MNEGSSEPVLPSITDPPARITTSRACLRCNYPLTGLSLDAACPECGLPIRESLRARRLIHSSPEYLRALHTGTRLILIGLPIILAGGIVSAPETSDAELIASVIMASGLVLVLIGWWFLATPAPADSADPRLVKLPRRLRIATALFGIIMFSFVPLQQAHEGVLLALALFLIILWFTHHFSSMAWIRRLAELIPDAGIARRTRTHEGLVIILYLFLPFIAYIMYWLLLNTLRGELARIRAQQRAAEHSAP